MHYRNYKSRRSGSTLVELFIVLCVLAIAAKITLPLLQWGVTASRASQLHAAASLRFDNAIVLLRADVWRAAKITTTPGELKLTNADGKIVTWEIGPGDQLQKDQQHWSDIGLTPGTAWSADGSAIRLVIPPRSDGSAKSITLASQTLLIAGGAP